jgi:hypothetical protein
VVPQQQPTFLNIFAPPSPVHAVRPVSQHAISSDHSANVFTPSPAAVVVTNSQQQSYLPPATAGFTPFSHLNMNPVHPSYTRPTPSATSATPTAVVYGQGMPSQQGVSFNIMGANKPRKLESLTHQNIKKFKSDFSHYHHETDGAYF